MNAEELGEARFRLHFGVSRSCRYHHRRMGFLDGVSRWSGGLAMLASSSAFVSLVSGETRLPIYLAAVAAVCSAVDVFFGAGTGARDHRDLYRRFVDLDKKVRALPVPCTEAQLAECTGDRLEIERDEPAVFRALDMVCHNEECTSRDCDEDQLASLSWRHRLLCHLYRFNTSTYRNAGRLPRARSAKVWPCLSRSTERPSRPSSSLSRASARGMRTWFAIRLLH